MTAGAVSAPLIIPITHLHTHRAKNHVDTQTPVSIHSETPSSQIFFSLDGSKPEPEHRGRSRKYSGPLLLHAGKVTVRAVAVSRDGRRSSMVTKVFIVDLADPNRKQSDQALQLLFCFQRPSEGASAAAPPRPPDPRMMGNSPLAGPPFVIGRLGSPNRQQQTGARPPSASSGVLSSTQTSRFQRESDFLRCAQCLTLRPSDPFSRLCAQCGAALPGLPAQRPPPAEGGQMVSCVSCGSLVPANTQSCLICETSVASQQLQASLKLQDHVMCVSCGCGNPTHVSRCLSCESRLQPAVSGSAPPGRRLSCSRCKRLNRSDARFCDWCGSKPGYAVSCVSCWRCGASAPPYASYCPACSAFLQAPPATKSCSDIKPPVGGGEAKRASATWKTTPSKGPASSAKKAPPTAECSTQTVGLYYPSATELQRKEQQREKHSRANAERNPPPSAVSPGRGFWRQQVDHVCSHLRSYAQNNASFRTLLGEPRLGRLVSAVIQEDQHEVTVSVSFVAAGQDPPPLQVDPAGDAVGAADSLSSVTETSVLRGSVRSAGRMKPLKLNPTPKPPVMDVRAAEGAGSEGDQVSAVQQLLDQK
ncbi:hypothetical protein PBY51_018348 [Eleginops maclovinus]|uniref:DZANK-type domain-containing protein n=1 Tax=Eleginops maclovinus TaxID=56733 RepID=A0AAN8AY15_ELEMC|nr:hypothetical protein PBY51_018348 [Eleginops maclovinus]